MKTITATATTNIDKPSIDLFRMVEITDGATTWYLSGRPYSSTDLTFGTYAWEPLIVDFGTITNTAIQSGDHNITASQVILTVDNIHDIFAGSDPTNYDAKIYDAYLPCAFSDRVQVFGGFVERVEAVNPKTLRVIISGYQAKLTEFFDHIIVDTTNYPGADPDDMGKMLPIAYGDDVQKCPFLNLDAGCMMTLTANMTATDMLFGVSDWRCLGNCDYPPKLMQIDDEKIYAYCDIEIPTSWIVTERGAEGTTAMPHTRGAVVVEVQDQYVYAIGHPVVSFGDVYVNGVRVISDYDTYTGRNGDEYTGYEGLACIVFTVLPTIVRQVELEVEDTIDVEDTIGVNDNISVGDNILFSASETDKTQYPSAGEANARDGNENTYYTVPTSITESWTYGGTSYGSISSVQVHCILEGTNTYGVRVYVDDTNYTTVTMDGNKQQFRITWTGSGFSWSDPTKIRPDAGAGVKVYEIWRVVSYRPTLTKSGGAYKGGSATKVGAAEKTGTVELVGNSAADTVVGGQVSADLEAYSDDIAGTITGYSEGLVWRPHHILEHILTVKCGLPSTVFNSTSYDAAGATLVSAEHKLQIVILEPPNLHKLIHDICYQSRCIQWWEAGAHNIRILANTGTTQKTLTAEMIDQETL